MSSLQYIFYKYNTKLSSAGQIFALYGRDIFESIGISWCKDLYKLIYEYFVEVLDCFVSNSDVMFATTEK